MTAEHIPNNGNEYVLPDNVEQLPDGTLRHENGTVFRITDNNTVEVLQESQPRAEIQSQETANPLVKFEINIKIHGKSDIHSIKSLAGLAASQSPAAPRARDVYIAAPTRNYRQRDESSDDTYSVASSAVSNNQSNFTPKQLQELRINEDDAHDSIKQKPRRMRVSPFGLVALSGAVTLALGVGPVMQSVNGAEEAAKLCSQQNIARVIPNVGCYVGEFNTGIFGSGNEPKDTVEKNI